MNWSALLLVVVLVLGENPNLILRAEPPEPSVPKIAGNLKCPANTLVRLSAVGLPDKSALVWRVTPMKGVDRATTDRMRLEFVAPPGTYDVTLLVITNGPDGAPNLTETTVQVELAGCTPVPPVVPPHPPQQLPGKANPVGATGSLIMGNAGCTATVVWPRRTDGRWEILTASHCTPGVGGKGKLALKDGRALAVTVGARNTAPDLTWLLTDDATLTDLPYAILAEHEPEIGVGVWQAGYGTDHPKVRKDGTVTGEPNSAGMLSLLLSVSHGDSGGGVFRADTGELVSAVCCTTSIAHKAQMFGGGVAAIRRLRAQIVSEERIQPMLFLPMLTHPVEGEASGSR